MMDTANKKIDDKNRGVDTPRSPWHRRWGSWLAVGVALLALTSVGLSLLPPLASSDKEDSRQRAASAEKGASLLTVTTVQPVKQTLVRTYEQPGSIIAWAEADIYAKVSGYVKWIARDQVSPPQTPTPDTPTPLASRELLTRDTLLALLSGKLPDVAVTVPMKDLGSEVQGGEVLLVIDSPELVQEVAHKESLMKQAEAELALAQAHLETARAAVGAAEAVKNQAAAEVARYYAEYVLQEKQLDRLRRLVRDRTVTPENLDEQQNKTEAAKSAWKSSEAKAKAAEAELAIVSSKVTAAEADVGVREQRVHVARDEYERAKILAEYGVIRAPFSGTISSRDVDEGDFVQFGTSGQGRRLMTLTALHRVKVVLQVPEREAIWVQVGTEALLQVDAHTGWTRKGRVTRVSPVLDRKTRTRRVEIDLDNNDHKLMPGMYGQVVLTLQKIENAQAIPATAVFSRRGEQFIILVEDGVARRQRVRIRFDDGKKVEVVKLIEGVAVPLDGSEELVISNKGEIADGQRVRTIRASIPEPGR